MQEYLLLAGEDEEDGRKAIITWLAGILKEEAADRYLLTEASREFFLQKNSYNRLLKCEKDIEYISYILYLQYYSVICRPSDHTEWSHRDGRSM